MDLVDLIIEKRFLGQEFLTWLWFKSEERGGTIALSSGDIILVIEQHLLLESGEGESLERVVCQGKQAELKEAKTAMAMGKKLEQARMRMARGDYEWRLSMSGGLMEYRNVRPPKTMSMSEDSDETSREGRLLDRIGLLEETIRTMDELFKLFLHIRLSADWNNERSRVQAWIKKA